MFTYIEIFKLLGVEIEIEEHRLIVNSPGYQHFNIPHQTLYTGNSGTTTRLLAGLLSGLGIECVLSGDASIGKRPMNRILRPLKLMNANINGIENNYTPLIIKPSPLMASIIKWKSQVLKLKCNFVCKSIFKRSITNYRIRHK